MIGIILARRYAKAIIGLAQEAGQVSEVGEELAKIAAVFDRSPELVHFFVDPTIPFQKKEKVLEDFLGKGEIQDLTGRFVNFLLAKGRLLGIREIASTYKDLEDELENKVRAKIVSAITLEDAEVNRIRKVLSDLSGKEVIMELEVDENILGGIVARLGSETYDGSLRNQLRQVRGNLSKGR